MLDTIQNVILKKNIFSHARHQSYEKNNSDFFSHVFCNELTKNLLSKEIEFSNIVTKKKRQKYCIKTFFN
ncbi:hypothetical protein [Buchnera aphidicola]|uniref:hypothetical protein n=1 Tax=Buchnera aphidicola TaxID=9 RepID=UPI0034640285